MAKIYEISLPSVSTNGAICSNLSVVFEKPSCANIKCDFDGKKLVIKIPDECAGECLYAVVTCNDPDMCSDCPRSERIKICPCSSNSDCEDCEQCIGNLCVSICDEGKTCENGRCSDCSDSAPCDCNQICVTGNCQCPPSKPYLNDKGCCTSCRNDGDCPPCTVCTPEGCMPVDCVEGACDPSTGECVGCINSGDCTGENECCKDKKCECCEGFVRDLVSGLCVPKPDCEKDGDCKECEVCVDGDCVPLQCPIGFICVGGKCKKICDCDEVYCSKTESCVALNTDTCYCNECSGACNSSSDCGDGCYCVNSECIPKPCKGACENGADCGDGCGCLDGECVPCADHSCDNSDCTDVLGCVCNDKNVCEDKKGCAGECETSHDCGLDCTCYEGECVPCTDFPCENGDCETHAGCRCNNSGDCEGDPNYKCSDSHTAKYGECDAEGKIALSEGCACSYLTLNTKIVPILPASQPVGAPPLEKSLFFYAKVELRKGHATSYAQAVGNPLLTDTNHPDIADNDTPLSGTIEVVKKVTIQKYTIVGGKKVKYGNEIEDASLGGKRIVSVKDKSIAAFSDTSLMSFIPVGVFIDDLTQVTKTVFSFESAALEFPNQCKYAGKYIGKYVIDSSSSSTFEKIAKFETRPVPTNFESFTQISSPNKRAVRHKWFRSKTGAYAETDVFRDLYIPSASGISGDKILGPDNFDPKGKYPLIGSEGELWGNRYYAHEVDCGCDDKFRDLGLSLFCNPNDFKFKMENCNSKVVMLTPFEPCDVNQDITQWGYPIDADVQTKYELWLNGIHVTDFVHSKSKGMVVDGNSMKSMFDLEGFKISNSDFIPISVIELRINNDKGGKCTIKKLLSPVVPPKLTPATLCYTSGLVSYTFNKTTMGIEKIETTSPLVNIQDNATTTMVYGPAGKSITLKITLKTGCVITQDFQHDCCANLKITNTTGVSVTNSSVVTLKSAVVGGTAPYSVKYSINGNTDNYKYFAPNYSLMITIGKGDTMNIVATVEDANGCTDQVSYSISNININNPQNGDKIVAVPEAISCGLTGRIMIDIPNDPTLVNTKLVMKRNGGSKEKLAITAQMLGQKQYLTGFVGGNTFQLNSLEVSGVEHTEFVDTNIITLPPNLNDNKPKLDNFLVKGGTTPVNICLGGNVDLTFKGSPNSLIGLNDELNSVTLDSSGDGLLNVSPLLNTNYKVTSITNYEGTCSGTVGLNTIRTVNVVPSAPINVLSNLCNNLLTQRTIIFDGIDTAKDQNGVSLPVLSNSVTVNPTLITEVNVAKNNGTCDATLKVNVDSCNCIEYSAVLAGEPYICAGDETTLAVSVSGGVAPYSYQWYENNVQSGPPTSMTTKTIIPSQTSIYRVEVLDFNACTSTSNDYTIVVEQTAEPVVSLAPGETGVQKMTDTLYEVCDNSGTTTFVVAPYGDNNFAWSISGAYSGSIIASGLYTTINSADLTGVATLTVSYSSNHGCVSTKSITLSEVVCGCSLPPTVSAGVDQSISPGQTVNLNGTYTNSPGVHWSGGLGTFANPNSATTTYTPALGESGVVTLTLTTTGTLPSGCVHVSDSMNVTIVCPAGCNEFIIDIPQGPFAENVVVLTEAAFETCNGTGYKFFSNNNNTGHSGSEEYIVKNTSACTDQQVADDIFGNPPGSRILVPTLADLAASMQEQIRFYGGPYSNAVVTGISPGGIDKLSFSNLPCKLIKQISFITFNGDSVTCGTPFTKNQRLTSVAKPECCS